MTFWRTTCLRNRFTCAVLNTTWYYFAKGKLVLEENEEVSNCSNISVHDIRYNWDLDQRSEDLPGLNIYVYFLRWQFLAKWFQCLQLVHWCSCDVHFADSMCFLWYTYLLGFRFLLTLVYFLTKFETFATI